MGGLSKKAYQFTRLKNERGLPTLIVDGGSLLFKNARLAEGRAEQDKITAATIVKAYNLTGYDAVGVGGRDLAAGLDFLLEIRDESRFDWLSANIIDPKTGTPLFKPFITRQLGELEAAVIGLTGPTGPAAKPADGKVVIQPWQDHLPSIIEKLADSHAFIVLLTDLGIGACREIADAFPAVNLIVRAGNIDSGAPPLFLTDNTILIGTGRKGKYIGVLEVAWRTGAGWRTGDHQALTAGKKERSRLLGQINRLEGRPELKDHYEEIRTRLASLEITIEQLEKKERSAAGTVSSFDNRFVAMDVSLPDHPAVLDLVDENKRSVSKMNRRSLSAAGAKDGVAARGFSGWSACAKCHRQQVKTWRASRHASSYLTLVEKGQQFNLECLPCHLTGVDPEDPATAMGITADLQAVGCESCHGPGS
ncbi:MAG: UshA-like (seleno)protein, partial [Desulfurivibrionaceae bacterium]|nr:UshA-like (seleno)protein [Desulfurivibrionaceae bacterium]